MGKIIEIQDIKKNIYRISTDDLIWRPSVYAFVIKNGCILLSRENAAYSLPGGGVVIGESLEESLKREVKEETGINVTSILPLSFESTFFALDEFPATAKKQYVQSILLFYTAECTSDEISLDYEPDNEKGYHQMAEWVPLGEVDKITITSNYDWRFLLKSLL